MLRIVGTRLNSQRTIIIFNKNYTTAGNTKDKCPKPDNKKDISNVPGLSDKVLCIPDYPVGFKGAQKNSEYKNPEYFCYHVDSFADAFIEMDKFRLPAPSNKK